MEVWDEIAVGAPNLLRGGHIAALSNSAANTTSNVMYSSVSPATYTAASTG